MSEKSLKIPDPGNKYNPLDISDLISECKKSWNTLAKPYLARAEFNERTMHGDQWVDIDQDFEVHDTAWPSWSTKSTRNLLKNLILTYASKLTEDRPFVRASPTTPTGDIRKAEIATAILKYYQIASEWDDKSFQAAVHAQTHGSIGFKVVWDPLAGVWDEGKPVVDELTGVQAVDETGAPMLQGSGWSGSLRIDVVSIFEFGTDGSQDVDRSNYVWFSRHADIYEAKALMRAAGYNEQEVEGLSSEEYTDIWGDKKEGIPLTELWYKPGFRFPDGLFAVQVGEYVVALEDFPYDHGQLPIAIAKIGDRRGSPFGSSHVNDAAPIQRSINKNVTALDRQSEMIAKVYLMAHGSVIEAIQEGSADHGMIPMNSPEWSQYTRYLEPPNRISVLVSSLEDNTNALFAVFGLNELLTGAESMKSGTAAKSIAFLNKLDSMKMAGASRSFNSAIRRVWGMAMKLCQQYMPEEIFVEMTGADGSEIEIFRSQDFDGLDVFLENTSGFDYFSATGQENAQANMQMMGPTPDLMDRANTGLKQGRYQNADKKVVRAMVNAAVSGQPVELDQNVDPNTAIEELTIAYSENSGTQAAMAIQSLIQQYKQLQQQAMTQAQGMAGGQNG
jgi:hypothetical protein